MKPSTPFLKRINWQKLLFIKYTFFKRRNCCPFYYLIPPPQDSGGGGQAASCWGDPLSPQDSIKTWYLSALNSSLRMFSCQRRRAAQWPALYNLTLMHHRWDTQTEWAKFRHKVLHLNTAGHRGTAKTQTERETPALLGFEEEQMRKESVKWQRRRGKRGRLLWGCRCMRKQKLLKVNSWMSPPLWERQQQKTRLKKDPLQVDDSISAETLDFTQHPTWLKFKLHARRNSPGFFPEATNNTLFIFCLWFLLSASGSL